MLVDPLAAFFRPDLEGEPALHLEITRVEVDLLPPLARIAVTRTFINPGDEAIEAVLTLPAAQPDEVTYGLTVTVDGAAYRATAQPRRGAARDHEAATAEGRLSILHERLAGDVQLVSIAGVAPMSMVGVRIESVRPLERLADGLATLVIPLSADPRRTNRGLADADRLLTTRRMHPATITVTMKGLDVTLPGRDGGLVVPGQSTPIDCAAPVMLHIAAQSVGGLDLTTHHVGERDGWEAGIEAPQETIAGGLEPVVDVSGLGGRRDWIVGRATSGGVSIRVVAPSPLAGGAELSPQARAMAAFAAAHLIDSASPVTPAALRLAANILDRTASLAFVGSGDRALDRMPHLRKVALPQTPGAWTAPPYPDGPVRDTPRPNLPEKPGETTPGSSSARPRQRPPAWNLARWLLEGSTPALILLWGLGATVWAPFPLEPVTIGMFVAILLNAAVHFPRGDGGARARGRLPLLLILALPFLASLISGPFGLISRDLDAVATSRVIVFQWVCIGVAAALPLVLMVVMRGARRFTLDIGVLGLGLAFFSVSVAIITLSPGD